MKKLIKKIYFYFFELWLYGCKDFLKIVFLKLIKHKKIYHFIFNKSYLKLIT